MGRSLGAHLAYGFGIECEGQVPDEVEAYSRYGDGDVKIPDRLEIGFYGCDHHQSPVIYAELTEIWANGGVPGQVGRLEVSADDINLLVEAHKYLQGVIKASPDWDERWGPTVGEIGWIMWGNYG